MRRCLRRTSRRAAIGLTVVGTTIGSVHADVAVELLGSLPGGDESIGYSINPSGHVAGRSHSADGPRAFRFTDSMLDLGVLPKLDESGAFPAATVRRTAQAAAMPIRLECYTPS